MQLASHSQYKQGCTWRSFSYHMYLVYVWHPLGSGPSLLDVYCAL